MNFFKSIFSEDPDPHSSEEPEKSDSKSQTNTSVEEHQAQQSSSSTPTSAAAAAAAANGGSGWTFGGLIRTLATQSESVIEIYRRDLKEFGSGLQKETATFREVASRAVKDLPASIEVGASAIDGVLKSTAEIISHGKDDFLSPPEGESDSDALNSGSRSSSRRYSRFDAQLLAIQTDANTYCNEPEDLEDFNKWKLGFVLEEKREELTKLVDENETIQGIYKSLVPNAVDREIFWFRYFYRVHKLKQQEDVRANLVKRAISIDMDEELSWDVDDEDNEEIVEPLKGNGVSLENKKLVSEDLPQVADGTNKIDEPHFGNPKSVDDKVEDKASLDKGLDHNENEVKIVKVDSKSEEKAEFEGKVENGGLREDADVSGLPTQPSPPTDEDLEWDEIEDVGSGDEKKVTFSGHPNRAEFRKRPSAAEEDEDLSWDIEDDDEPIAKPCSDK